MQSAMATGDQEPRSLGLNFSVEVSYGADPPAGTLGSRGQIVKNATPLGVFPPVLGSPPPWDKTRSRERVEPEAPEERVEPEAPAEVAEVTGSAEVAGARWHCPRPERLARGGTAS